MAELVNVQCSSATTCGPPESSMHRKQSLLHRFRVYCAFFLQEKFLVGLPETTICLSRGVDVCMAVNFFGYAQRNNKMGDNRDDVLASEISGDCYCLYDFLKLPEIPPFINFKD